MGHLASLRPITVLIAEDSDPDYMLLEHALQETKTHLKVKRAWDGTDAVQYLKGEGPHADRSEHPFPDIVVVDLKMPQMSGLEVLQWIRDNPEYRVIPTIVFSTSSERHDVQRAYELGANTYFTKPSHLRDLLALCTRVAEYWGAAEIPPRRAQPTYDPIPPPEFPPLVRS